MNADKLLRRLARATALGAAVAITVPAAAFGQSDLRQSAELRFTEQTPGSTTGLELEIDYFNPVDPAAKPPSVRRVVAELAEGAAIDTAVPERCPASDAELLLLGSAACPVGSRVGTGLLTLDTGLPEPARFLVEDLALFNNTSQLIFLFTDRTTGLRLPSRAPIEDGRRITAQAPPLPGAPPDGAAVDTVSERLAPVARVIDGEPRNYITTPPFCPPSGAWVGTVSFTYADGVTQTVSSESPCTASAPSAAFPEPAPAAAKKKCKKQRKGTDKRRKRCKKR